MAQSGLIKSGHAVSEGWLTWIEGHNRAERGEGQGVMDGRHAELCAGIAGLLLMVAARAFTTIALVLSFHLDCRKMFERLYRFRYLILLAELVVTGWKAFAGCCGANGGLKGCSIPVRSAACVSVFLLHW